MASVAVADAPLLRWTRKGASTFQTGACYIDMTKIFKRSTEFDESDNDDDNESVDSSSSSEEHEDNDHTTSDDDQGIGDSPVAQRVKGQVRLRKKPARFSSPMAALKKRKRDSSVPQAEEHQRKQRRQSEKQEKAAVQYVTEMCNTKETREQTIFRTLQVAVAAEDMRCLILHNTSDAKEKYLCNGLIDAYAEHIKDKMDKSKKRMVCPTIYGYMMSDDEKVAKCLDPDMCHIYYNIVAQFFSHELVFFPLQVKNSIQEHWILVVMNNKKKTFQVLDSLWNLDMYRSTIYNLRFGIARLTSAAKATTNNLPTDVHSWDTEFIEGLPKQTDGFSCG